VNFFKISNYCVVYQMKALALSLRIQHLMKMYWSRDSRTQKRMFFFLLFSYFMVNYKYKYKTILHSFFEHLEFSVHFCSPLVYNFSPGPEFVFVATTPNSRAHPRPVCFYRVLHLTGGRSNTNERISGGPWT
jgi:hypothetical protein